MSFFSVFDRRRYLQDYMEAEFFTATKIWTEWLRNHESISRVARNLSHLQKIQKVLWPV